ncbi:MAG: FecR domain-containing protein [Verrucomicrobiales bacterium]|nr:FecR domain-containing protein [Verrucomicrobiales bacterium]
MKNDTELLLEYLQDDISQQDELLLQQRLKAEPDLCDQLITLANEEAVLSDWAQAEKMSTTLDHLAFDPVKEKNTHHLWSLHPAWAVAAVASLVTALTLAGIIHPSLLQKSHQQTGITSTQTTSPTDPNTKQKTASNIAALLVNEAAAHFAPQYAPAAVQFKLGRYQLQSGAAHMRFVNGVDLIYRAPVDFEIIDPFHIALHHGSMRAIVPDSGTGFTIGAPQIDFEDLGTEFGVSVDSKTGTSELHVFEGRVDIKSSDNQALLQAATLGQSYTMENGRVASGALLKAADFPTPQSIGYQRWKNWSLAVQKDPSLLIYYDFTRQTKSPSILKNQVSNSSVEDGIIQGPIWVSGRWPNKDALLFERDHDAVLLNIPEPLTAFTFAVWVKVNRLDHELSTILDSDQWEPGDTHFQISRSRRNFTFGYNGGGKREHFPIPLPLQHWVHLAVIGDGSSKKVHTYVNGKLSSTAQLGEDAIITPGSCRLGDWKPHPDWENPIRSLRGRMDEVILWQRALRESELQKMIDAGSPTSLWAEQTP